ncbi:prolyl oligopeptidase family serine peptidase, partial [Acinetobacter baumannii]
MKFVDRVRTPTLLIVGDHDFRTPVSQAEEFYKALKIRGVDTRLILVNGATHQPWLNSPSDFMRVQLYL